MNWKECKALIRDDLRRSTDIITKTSAAKYLITNASFKMSFWFRLGTYLDAKKHGLLYFLVFWHYKSLMYKTGIQLPIGTQVGGGLKFYHFGDVVINKNATIGKNVSIYNGVTIGINLRPDGKCCPPFVGDNVVLCTGAKVIGNVHIGNNCVIGANAVVTKDIPEDSVAAGVPAKVISQNGGGHKYVKFFINQTDYTKSLLYENIIQAHSFRGRFYGRNRISIFR